MQMIKYSGSEPWHCGSHNCHLQAKLYFTAKLNYIITNVNNKFKVLQNATTFKLPFTLYYNQHKCGNANLRSHYKFMVHNEVWSEAHSKKSRRWMKMTWHSCPTVHILSDTFQSSSLMKICCNTGNDINCIKHLLFSCLF